MKKKTLCTLLVGTLTLAGCADSNVNNLLSAGAELGKAATLSDADAIELAQSACAASDRQAKVADAKNRYATRLNRVMHGLGNEALNGQQPNYKVYMTPDVNAWAMANGCIRVYSGLMDLMNNDELRAVIGHEMGHVALGHSKRAMQLAYSTSAARSAIAASGNSVAASLSQSQLGDLTEKFINAQFSQAQEYEADDYSFALLTRKKLNRQGLVSAFEKLSKLDGGHSDMLSSHPSSPDRAQRIRSRL